MPNPLIGTHRLPPLPQRPTTPPPLAGVPKIGTTPQPLTAPAALSYVPLHAPPLRVLPPVLPPLPPIPAANPWVAKTKPSAALVQSQYVDLRLEELEANRKPGRKAALEQLEQLLLDKLDPAKKRKTIPFKELLRVYNEIERNLQSADLTINFMCDAWFSEENQYD